ncbi:MBL fold metallo-hydrolase [Altererythrobacter salegens]|uniref:MBL fold metallo-hydrolase n=1 Tax=Croceibacterium salegens TaxID=1737568 RepID=A0A6I4SV08_9SPHN|nr:MBL fold metallo-hydrolase [Croceibacterium salegens]MXO59328.1 MBL fold metallo-hydrolase [Croceibacterium salegens]
MNRSLIIGTIVATGVIAACATAPSADSTASATAGASTAIATTPMDTPPPGYQPATGPGLPGVSPIEHVKGQVYKIFGAGGNTTVFVMSDGVALVDTKLPNTGQAILDEVRKVTDKPVTIVINTHSHPDHVGSNQFFKDQLPTVEVVAQANSASRMAVASGPFPANPATTSFETKTTLGAGKDRIDVYYFGPGHTNGDAFIVFANDKVMATGDIMAWSMAPLIDPSSGGSAIGAADTLMKAAAGIKGVDTIVEGHGYIQPWSRFVDFANFNKALADETRKVNAAGGTPKDVVDNLVDGGKWTTFLTDHTLTGLEYGSTGQNRALINAIVGLQELRGEKPVTIMNLKPEEAYKR